MQQHLSPLFNAEIRQMLLENADSTANQLLWDTENQSPHFF